MAAPISDELRRSFVGRLYSLEGSLLHLIREVLECHPVDFQRDQVRVLRAKVELMTMAIEEAIVHDPSAPNAQRDKKVTDIRRAADELAVLQSKVERARRDHERELEDLEHERQRMDAEQVLDELDSLGGGPGPEA